MFVQYIYVYRERERTKPDNTHKFLHVNVCALKIIQSCKYIWTFPWLLCLNVSPWSIAKTHQKPDRFEDILLYRKADNATRHKTVVSLLGLLSMDLCQSPVGFVSLLLLLLLLVVVVVVLLVVLVVVVVVVMVVVVVLFVLNIRFVP